MKRFQLWRRLLGTIPSNTAATNSDPWSIFFLFLTFLCRHTFSKTCICITILDRQMCERPRSPALSPRNLFSQTRNACFTEWGNVWGSTAKSCSAKFQARNFPGILKVIKANLQRSPFIGLSSTGLPNPKPYLTVKFCLKQYFSIKTTCLQNEFKNGSWERWTRKQQIMLKITHTHAHTCTNTHTHTQEKRKYVNKYYA